MYVIEYKCHRVLSHEAKGIHVHQMKGISLVEVIVSLMISSILLGFACPAIGRMADRARIAHVQTMLSDSFLTASRLAVTTGSATVICPLDDKGDCDEVIDWSKGWLVFVDIDGDRRPSDRDTVARRFDPVAGGLRLYSTQGRKRIVFQPQGDSAGTNVTFTVCGRQRDAIGLLMLSNSGRFHITNPKGSEQTPQCA